MGYKEATLTFYEDKITYFGDPFENDEDLEGELGEIELEVMMEWESPIMKRSAEFICQNGGDILEIGFGMGIASDWIQTHSISSHVIIEMHPQIADKAREWASDKPNVTIIEGDWIDILPTLASFDGILFDTYGFFGHWGLVAESISAHANEGCHISFWNCCRGERNGCGFGDDYNITYEQIEVDPPQNTYFNDRVYFLPKVIF